MTTQAATRPPEPEALDATFGALASATRRAMLVRLSAGEATVAELREPFDISAPAISKHLKVLEDAGLISRTRRGRYRPCAIDLDPLVAAQSWVDECRATWEARLNRLEDHLQSLAATPNITTSTETNTATEESP